MIGEFRGKIIGKRFIELLEIGLKLESKGLSTGRRGSRRKCWGPVWTHSYSRI